MKNTLILSDAVELGRTLSDINLCYLDPPFNVGTDFSTRNGSKAYSDRWGGLDKFLSFLEPVLSTVQEFLAPQGVFWLHLDYRSIHEAKLLCDHIFGRTAFRGEVIWIPGNGARKKYGPSITHQTLLIYTKDPSPNANFTWNTEDPTLREPFSPTSLNMHFRHTDENGRLYRDRNIGGKTYRYYADHGRKLGSVWADIPAMTANTPIHKEGTGYPTQKPEKLLERIILLSSSPGDTVCDLMCGSGTTLAVAARLGRHFIGGDSSSVAIETCQKRFEAAGIEFTNTLPVSPT